MTPFRGLLIALMAALDFDVATLAAAADPPFPENMVVLRGQPSVFKVVTTADVILETPRQVNLDLAAVKADLPTVTLTGEPATDADKYWTLIGQNPAKYLNASDELVRQTFENALTGGGSAFAVSREGIFLTNAHVVNDKPGAALGAGEWGLLRERVLVDLEEFVKVLGDTTTRPPEEVKAVVQSVFEWYASRSMIINVKIRSISIVLDYKVNTAKIETAIKRDGVAAALAQPLQAEEVRVPATVLAIGETMPGKDVAILKATFDPAEQEKLIRRSEQKKLLGLEEMLAEIQNDRVICLPLGNSDDVLPQAKVQALGLPENAFNPQIMDAASRYKVSARAGQIGQTKRMSGNGGWDAFEMTAAIDHGDSGGPVLDEEGRVIAINMGYASDRTNPLRLAVPINIAKEMLAQAGIKPDPGQAALHWEKSLRLFAAVKYEESLNETKIVRQMMEGDAPFLSGRECSWYVKDFAGRCLQKLGKIP